MLSGWAKADAVTDNVLLRESPAYDHTKQFGLRATVYFTDGELDWFYVPFHPDITDWQFASLTIVTPSYRAVRSIDVACVYEANLNEAYFDNISLVREVVSSTAYDENGKPISSVSTGVYGDDITYDDNGNVKTVTTRTSDEDNHLIKQTFTYDSTFCHRLVSQTNTILTTRYGYDAYGNVISTTLESNSSTYSKTMVSASAYTI